MKRKIRLSERSGREDCPLVLINVLTRLGTVAPIRFCIDTGADVSALSIDLARREAIIYPPDERSRGVVTGLVGSVSRYRGTVRVQIAGLSYTWPCDFLDTTGPASFEPYAVIGRAGFVDDFAFCLNKPYCTLRRRTFRALFLPPWTPTHQVEDSL
jgi:hypothetical protein